MPIGEDLLLKICPAKFITTLDCAAGYWQIPIRECDTYKTGFATHRGLYEWLVTPFGLSTAGNHFQRVMDDILRVHSQYACAYVDDTACFSLKWLDHLYHLEQVLLAFEDVNMSLKFSKCKFARPKVQFIGHNIGSGIRSPVTDKVMAIRDIPEPQTKKSLRSFLGMLGFYRMYLPHFSECALPLTELTKNSQSNKICFNEIQRRAFLLLKDKLCKCTNLYAVDFAKSFHMFTDASDYAIGVALTQLSDDGKTHCPVGFASCKFSDVQSRWAVIEKECYSSVYGLKKCEHIIFGYKIFLWTDHNPLAYLTTVAPQSAKLTRWALSLTKFNIEVNHIDGKSNVVADYLSRAYM
jgi:hypothetical protein